MEVRTKGYRAGSGRLKKLIDLWINDTEYDACIIVSDDASHVEIGEILKSMTLSEDKLRKMSIFPALKDEPIEKHINGISRILKDVNDRGCNISYMLLFHTREQFEPSDEFLHSFDNLKIALHNYYQSPTIDSSNNSIIS